MSLDIRMIGAADLYKLKKQFSQVGSAGLGKQMNKRLEAATKPLKAMILAEVPKAMPSGYAPVLSKSLQFRMSSKTAKYSTELRYKVHADGKQEKRDVPALNKGILRSPRGRRRQTWVSQRVPVGFVDKPFARTLPAVQKEMVQVLNDVADQLKR